MHQIVNHIKDNPKSRVYILLAFLIITTLLFVFRSSTVNEEPAVKQSKTMEITRDNPTERIVGGLGEEREKDAEVTDVVERIKPELESKSNLKFESIEVLSVKRQTVAGINFFIKAKGKIVDGDEKIIHLRVYRPIRGELSLTAYQLDKTLGDKLEYFQ